MRYLVLLSLFAAVAPLAAAQGVAPPYAYLEYCAKNRDPGCVRAISPADLAAINMVVTDAIKTQEDVSVLDAWEAFPPSHAGDCDDDVATKRMALVGLGVDPKAMHFEAGLANGERHIVLVVTLNGKDWVMDRKTPNSVYPASKRPYPWVAQERETQTSVAWQEGAGQ